MNGYDIHLQIQDLKQEIAELSKEIQELDHDDPDQPVHPDLEFLEDLLWKSEKELEWLMDSDVVDQL